MLLLGCSADPVPEAGGSDPSPEAVTLQLNWLPEPQFGGIYQAELDGVFAGEGLDVTIQPGAAGVSAPQLADSGRVEFAVVGGSQILQLNDRGGDLVALFAVYQHDPHGIMVRADSGFQNLSELWADPEATIGCEAELAFVREIDRAFGVEDGARLVAYNLPAFLAGTQQATQCFVTSEPVALELDGIATRVFMTNESGFDPYNTVLVTRRAYLDAAPETCAAMVRAFTRGWEGYLQAPERTNAEMSRLNPGMSPKAMALSASRQIPLIRDETTSRLGLGCMTAERWRDLAERLERLELINQVPKVEDMYRWKGR